MAQEFFDELRVNDVQALRRFATRRTHPEGTIPVRLGERPDALLIIERGEVEFPEIAFRWLRLRAHALDRAHQRLLEMAGKSALEQVSYLLLHESAERDEPVFLLAY